MDTPPPQQDITPVFEPAQPTLGKYSPKPKEKVAELSDHEEDGFHVEDPAIISKRMCMSIGNRSNLSLSKTVGFLQAQEDRGKHKSISPSKEGSEEASIQNSQNGGHLSKGSYKETLIESVHRLSKEMFNKEQIMDSNEKRQRLLNKLQADIRKQLDPADFNEENDTDSVPDPADIAN